MSFLAWIALAGCLLLGMALSSTYLRRLPVTSSGIYLALGLAISPVWLDLIEIDFVRESVLFEHLTAIAVIVSLFVGGLKLRLPLKHRAWTAAFRLAGPVMIATIAGVVVIAHYGFGLNWAAAILLGSVLAPTAPVLAGIVTVNDAGDQDRMRYGLSGEAGFNDGAAFPFVVFSLLWLEHGSVGAWAGEWALHRLLWAVPAGLLMGYGLGKGVSRLAILLRSRNPDSGATGDFLVVCGGPTAFHAVVPRQRTRMPQRWLMGWFGIRGIGSLYYLGYSINHGLDPDAAPLVGITLSVVALSVTVNVPEFEPVDSVASGLVIVYVLSVAPRMPDLFSRYFDALLVIEP